MTANPQHTPESLMFLPLSLEAERLATQLEDALHDPSANRDTFFQTLDRYAEILTTLKQQHEQRAPVVVEH